MAEFRVFGPPGTGKTTYLARQCERACERYDPHRVYALSFTRAAAKELAGRELPIPRENVGTVHSLCYHHADRPTILETDTTLLTEWNSTTGSRDGWIVTGEGRLDEPPVSAKPDSELREWNRRRGIYGRKADPAYMPSDFAGDWEAFKRDHGVVDFTDLLLLAPPTIGADVLLFDEAQDATPLMWSIVRQWGTEAKSFVVGGDDDQTLYLWLGASPESFLADLPDSQVRILSQSYRLPRTVHEQAAMWIERIRGVRQPKAFKPRNADGEVESRSYQWHDPAALAAEVADRANTGRTVMVLASCGYLLKPLICRLRAAGALYHNPYRQTRGDWNPVRRGGSFTRLASFIKLSRAWREVDGDALLDGTLWRDLAWMLRAEGNLVRGAKAQMAAAPDELPEWGTAAAWLTDDGIKGLDAGSLDWLAENITKGAAKALEYPFAVVKMHGERALAEPPRIIVGTIHSVKGGQADDVFVFPDLSWAAESARLDSLDVTDAIVRQFYVAMTRAREGLYLCASGGRAHVRW